MLTPPLKINSLGDKTLERITLKEYLSGLAMQNLQNVLLRKSADGKMPHDKISSKEVTECIAAYAVAQADALIRELEK
jgi:hypothetical protein